MQKDTGDLISITALPGERKISATYTGDKNTLRSYDDWGQYKLSVYRALEEMFSSVTESGKNVSCSVSSGGITQEFRGKLKLTGRGWEIAGDEIFDVFGALVSEEIDNVKIEQYED